MKSTIVVGIPSLNEASTIENVTRQVDLGLQRYFPEHSSVIVNTDSDSDDGTKDIFLNTETVSPKEYISTGRSGKGANLFRLLDFAGSINADVVCTVDADLLSIDPSWMRELISPIISGLHQYVLPIYTRGRYDGNITNHLCYPLLYSYFGIPVRQPIAGDFALSIDLAKRITASPKISEAHHYGVDIFMTMNALTGGFSTKEVYLGRKIHKPGFGNMVKITQQVSATLFSLFHQDLRSNRKSSPQYCLLDEDKRISFDPIVTRPSTDAIVSRLAFAIESLNNVCRDSDSPLLQLNLEFRKRFERDKKISLNPWCEYLSEVFKIIRPNDGTKIDFTNLGNSFTPIFLLRALTYFSEVETLEPQEVEELINSQVLKIKL